MAYSQSAVSSVIYFDENSTYNFHIPADWGVFAAYGVVLVLGFVGNLSIMLLVICDCSLRNTANLLITNIAIGDLLVMVVCVPTTMLLNVTHSYPGGLLYCKVVASLQVMSACVSSLTLAALSWERYQVITKPLGTRRRSSSRLEVTCALSFVWVSSILVATPIFVGTSDYVMQPFNLHVCEYAAHFEAKGKALKTLIFLVTFAVPSVILTIFNYRIARCLFMNIQENKRRHLSTSSGAVTQARSRRKLAVIVCVMVIVFIACWLPYHAFIFAQEIWIDRFWTHDAMIEMNKFISILPYTGSAVNPWIMYTMSTGYRQKLWRLLCCKRERLQQQRLRMRIVSLKTILTTKSNSRTSES